jgi:hypothetical protein
MGKKPSYRSHGEFRMPLGFLPEAFFSALAYAPRPDDIYLSAYPKCGTTWTQYMVYLLLHDAQPLAPDQSLGKAIPHLEEAGAAAVLELKAPRVIKTHLPMALFPVDGRARYLYIARNPFDCVVSFFHHTRGFPRHYDFADGAFDDFFECFLRGEVDFGDYFDHIVPWSHFWDRPNVLLLVYEDMRANPARAVERIAQFLAPELVSPALLGRVVRHSSFAAMSADQQRWSSPRAQGAPAFVRKGIVGDWRNVLSPRQTARLLAKFHARCKDSPVAGLWATILAQAAEHAGQAQDGPAESSGTERIE